MHFGYRSLRDRALRVTIEPDGPRPAHLRSFDAVVRHGGYHRAAEALHLTQPAVSRHLPPASSSARAPLRSWQIVLQANDRALARLLREGQAPFAFGVVDNLSEPVLPALLDGAP